MTIKELTEMLDKGSMLAFQIGDLTGVIETGVVGGKYHITFGLHPNMIEDAQWMVAETIPDLLELPIIDGQSLQSQLESIDYYYLIPMN